MENQSLRPTPLAFTQSTITGYNLYADLQHVHMILCLISFDFSNRVFLNIFDGSYYAETQHLSEVLFKYNLEMFYPFHQRWCFQESSLGFFTGTQHVQEALCNILREYSTNHPHGHSFQFHVTHDNSSSKKQNSDLISKGITSPWVEYNDGCAWGCGIHSLLFVIYYF